MPSNARDAKGLLLAAIADPNPVIVLEHKLLYKTSGEVPEEMYTTPIGLPELVQEGTDLVIVATGVMVSRSIEAASQLKELGISASIIDVRTLSPLDMTLINQVVSATGRVLLVQEAPKHVGYMAEIAARIAEGPSWQKLKAPIKRLCGLEIPIPYAPQLEQAAVPQVADIVKNATQLVKEN
jgi:pyruvate dehydrogenase E1 component beta subunit